MVKLEIVTLRLPLDMIIKIDKLVHEHDLFLNRSEFIRKAIIELLRKYRRFLDDETIYRIRRV